MSQENRGNSSAAPVSVLPAKRRRGRPRKDENLTYRKDENLTYMEKSAPLGSDLTKRNWHQGAESTAQADNALVGQIVSGVLDGSFDAGYLLTVKVGNTNTVLRGVVFEPGLSVPISAANDVAPHVKMFKRSEIPLPVIEPLNQVPASTPYYEANNEQPAKSVPKTVTAILLEGSASDSYLRKGPLNDANHVSQVAPQVNQAILPAKERQDGVHQMLPIASQASPSNIEKGKSTDILSNETSLSTEGAVNSNQSPLIVAQATEKSDITTLTNKSSDDFNQALPEVVYALPSEPTKTESPVVVLQESETSPQPRLSNGTTAANDLKLEPKTEISVKISLGNESGKGGGIAINQVPQVQTHVLGSALHLDPSVDAPNVVPAEINHPPLATPIGESQENRTSLFDRSVYDGNLVHLVKPRETLSDVSYEILKRDETTRLIEGSMTGAIEPTKDDLQTRPATDAFYDIQPTLAQHMEPLSYDRTAPVIPVELVTSTGFTEPKEDADPTQVNEVEARAAPYGA